MYQDVNTQQASTDDASDNYGRMATGGSTDLQHINSLFSPKEPQPSAQIFKAQEFEQALLDHYRKQGGFGISNTVIAEN